MLTGYKINPYVTQVFTTGPNSGSEVDIKFIISEVSSSMFLTSSHCGFNLEYKKYSPSECFISGTCNAPIINNITIDNCNYSNGYLYTLYYNVNTPIPVPTDVTIEWSTTPSFTSNVGGEIRLDLYQYITTSVALDSSPSFTNLPLNATTPIYFRIKSTCSGSIPSPWSDTYSISCNSSSSFAPLHKHIYWSGPITQDWCTRTGLTTVWSDNPELLSSTVLYRNNTGTQLAFAKLYSDNQVIRYWDGSTFTSTQFCTHI